MDDSRYVYIDDINIEPVLKSSSDEFVSKSCRLYPKQDSLSCRSTNENVIANGWEGYCLQKDPYNPEICLMWYPVDSISTFTNKDSGYQGKTPLYYCSKADGNFVLTEKRKPFYIKNDGGYTDNSCHNNACWYRCINTDHTYGECDMSLQKLTGLTATLSGGDEHFQAFLSDELKQYYDEYRVFVRTESNCGAIDEKKNRTFRLAIPKGVGLVHTKYGGKDWHAVNNVSDGDDFYSTPIQRGDEVTYTFKPLAGDGCAQSGNHKIKFVDGEAWYPYNGLTNSSEVREPTYWEFYEEI